jgi:hypothetical protein
VELDYNIQLLAQLHITVAEEVEHVIMELLLPQVAPVAAAQAGGAPFLRPVATEQPALPMVLQIQVVAQADMNVLIIEQVLWVVLEL